MGKPRLRSESVFEKSISGPKDPLDIRRASHSTPISKGNGHASHSTPVAKKRHVSYCDDAFLVPLSPIKGYDNDAYCSMEEIRDFIFVFNNNYRRQSVAFDTISRDSRCDTMDYKTYSRRSSSVFELPSMPYSLALQYCLTIDWLHFYSVNDVDKAEQDWSRWVSVLSIMGPIQTEFLSNLKTELIMSRCPL